MRNKEEKKQDFQSRSTSWANPTLSRLGGKNTPFFPPTVLLNIFGLVRPMFLIFLRRKLQGQMHLWNILIMGVWRRENFLEVFEKNFSTQKWAKMSIKRVDFENPRFVDVSLNIFRLVRPTFLIFFTGVNFKVKRTSWIL